VDELVVQRGPGSDVPASRIHVVDELIGELRRRRVHPGRGREALLGVPPLQRVGGIERPQAIAVDYQGRARVGGDVLHRPWRSGRVEERVSGDRRVRLRGVERHRVRRRIVARRRGDRSCPGRTSSRWRWSGRARWSPPRGLCLAVRRSVGNGPGDLSRSRPPSRTWRPRAPIGESGPDCRSRRRPLRLGRPAERLPAAPSGEPCNWLGIEMEPMFNRGQPIVHGQESAGDVESSARAMRADSYSVNRKS
jgi:hypothetical protein